MASVTKKPVKTPAKKPVKKPAKKPATKKRAKVVVTREIVVETTREMVALDKKPTRYASWLRHLRSPGKIAVALAVVMIALASVTSDGRRGILDVVDGTRHFAKRALDVPAGLVIAAGDTLQVSKATNVKVQSVVKSMADMHVSVVRGIDDAVRVTTGILAGPVRAASSVFDSAQTASDKIHLDMAEILARFPEYARLPNDRKKNLYKEFNSEDAFLRTWVPRIREAHTRFEDASVKDIAASRSRKIDIEVKFGKGIREHVSIR